MYQVRNTRPFPALLLLILLSMSFLAPAHGDDSPTPEFIAVKMYADWCRSCKILDPRLSQVQPEFTGGNILFVRFDFTDDKTIHQSSMLAGTLGLDRLYAMNARKTGYLAVVDRATGNVVERITKDHSEQEIRALLAKYHKPS